MITIYNIRGTNGSGKTTLARAFIEPNPRYNQPNMVDLTWYDSPTKADPMRRKAVEGYAMPHRLPGVDVLVVGSYRTACGGLDAVPDFKTTFAALDGAVKICRDYPRAERQAIVCEGILASTVWGSWGEYADGVNLDPQNIGARFAFCYLDTPLEVCLQRIKARQEAAGKVRDIKEELVADKIKAISATRARAIAAGHTVYDLPWERAEEVLRVIMMDQTLDLVKDYNLSSVLDAFTLGALRRRPAREVYRAS